MKIIGITGKAGSGKDTFAAFLIEALSNSGKRVFTDQLAAPIKMAVAGILDVDVSTIEERAFKEASLLDNYELDTSPRKMLQTLGTEWGRGIDEEIWLKLLMPRLEEYEENGADYCIITDVRFSNEQEWFENMGGSLIHIHRPLAQEVAGHISESGLGQDSDYYVSNTAGLHSLNMEAKAIADEMMLEASVLDEFTEALSSRRLNDVSPREWDKAAAKALPF